MRGKQTKGETPFTHRVKDVIKSIPRGKVATYGQVAALAGNHRAARQVAWVLHSSSERYKLPWHRVISGRGGVSLPPGRGLEEQVRKLKSEGILFKGRRTIDLERSLWEPGKRERLFGAFLKKLAESGQ